MKLVIYFILIFVFIKPSFSQEVFVKQVWGSVEFMIGNEKIVVKDLSSFSEKNGVFILKDKNSQLLIRIGDKLDVLEFSEDMHKFTLRNIISKKKDLHEKGDEDFLDKFFSLFSVSHNDDAKLDGLLVAEKSGISRSFNEPNIIFIETIKIMDGYPLKIEFSNSINSDKIENNIFNILVKDKYSDKIIFNQTITETSFTINSTTNSSLHLDWNIEINNIDLSKKIRGRVESLYIKSEQRKLFDELRDRAIAECETGESTYQIIFIESLRAIGLSANASYYLDLFIETNNNPKLINYKDYYTK